MAPPTKEAQLSDVDASAFSQVCLQAVAAKLRLLGPLVGLAEVPNLSREAPLAGIFERLIAHAQRGSRVAQKDVAAIADIEHWLPSPWPTIRAAIAAREKLRVGEDVGSPDVAALASLSVRHVGVCISHGELKGRRVGREFVVAADVARTWLRARGIRGL